MKMVAACVFAAFKCIDIEEGQVVGSVSDNGFIPKKCC